MIKKLQNWIENVRFKMDMNDFEYQTAGKGNN